MRPPATNSELIQVSAPILICTQHYSEPPRYAAHIEDEMKKR